LGRYHNGEKHREGETGGRDEVKERGPVLPPITRVAGRRGGRGKESSPSYKFQGRRGKKKEDARKGKKR